MNFLNLDSQKDAYHHLLRDLRVSLITYLSGHNASGKTTLAKRVIDELNSKLIAIYIDCCDLTNPAGFIDQVAQTLVKKFSSEKIKDASSNRVSTKESFIKFLKVYDEERQKSKVYSKSQKIVITLDHVDNLKRTNLIDTAQFLWSMTSIIPSISLFIISNDCYFFDAIKKQSERATMSKLTSFVTLKPWTTNDLVLAISRDKPKIRPELYDKFVRNTICCFSYKDGTGINRYYQVLKRLCLENFEDYIKNFDTGKNDPFAANLMIKKNKEDQKCEKDLTGVTMPSGTHTTTFICLFMSIYFGAYTTASDDKHNWVKNQKRVRWTTKQGTRRGDKPASSFTLERLLHIYRHLMAKIVGGAIEKYEMTVLPDKIMEYVSLLEHSFMLHRWGGDLLDGDTRYKVTNRFRKYYVQRQARLVGIELTHFTGIDD